MNKKILIVEDDPDVRRGYTIRLTAHHYDTFYAGDGVASISEAQKHRPDLIILDLGLPAGDGFSVLSRLRALPHLSEIPVIVISGRDPFVDRQRALDAGARAFVQKPVDNDRLLELIEKYTGGTADAYRQT